MNQDDQINLEVQRLLKKVLEQVEVMLGENEDARLSCGKNLQKEENHER